MDIGGGEHVQCAHVGINFLSRGIQMQDAHLFGILFTEPLNRR